MRRERRKEKTRGVNPGFPDFRSAERETDEKNLGTTLFSRINFHLFDCFLNGLNPSLFFSERTFPELEFKWIGGGKNVKERERDAPRIRCIIKRASLLSVVKIFINSNHAKSWRIPSFSRKCEFVFDVCVTFHRLATFELWWALYLLTSFDKRVPSPKSLFRILPETVINS